ncbi:MAG TPA: DNA polymerase III subunit gamma/tau [Firmicutes bacterium]|nr:DNA polymerase III subunit gamma/tau [Bacillota bacterium]
MGYLSLYRRWRPRTFDQIVGQGHVTTTLKNALSLGRIAHAYLFCGPRGTGKTSVAKVLAKALNCEKGPTADPCDACEACKRIREGYSMDVIEIDAASNRGIDEIRDLREKVKFAAAEERYKVYIIDEVHMLTTEAFNALLKTLEEPPAYVVFILATTEPHRVPATILSRCQRFDFRRLTVSEVAGQLKDISSKEGVTLDDRAASFLAKNAEGSMRDALSLLDQCMAFGTGEITYESALAVLGAVGPEGAGEFANLVARRDLLGGLSFIQRLHDEGKDLRQFLKDAIEYFRDLLIVKECPDPARLVDGFITPLQELRKQAGAYTSEDLQRAIDVLCAAEGEMRWAARPRLVMEMALVRLTRGAVVPAGSPGGAGEAGGPSGAGGAGDDLLKRVRMLEEAVRKLNAAVQDIQRQHQRQRDIQGQQRVAPRSDMEVAMDVGEASPADAGVARLHGLHGDEGSGGGDSAGAGKGTLAALSIEDVRAKWPEVLEALRVQRKMSLRGYLLAAAPVSIDGDCLLLSFQHAFHKEQVESSGHRAVVEKVLASVLGQPLRIRCETVQENGDQEAYEPGGMPLAGEGERLDLGTDDLETEAEGEANSEIENEAMAAIAASLEPQESLADNPVVKEVLDLFGGHILKIEPKQR